MDVQRHCPGKFIIAAGHPVDRNKYWMKVEKANPLTTDRSDPKQISLSYHRKYLQFFMKKKKERRQREEEEEDEGGTER